MSTVLTFYINEIGSWINWLSSWQIYNIPFLWYLMGFSIIGALFDFIFG